MCESCVPALRHTLWRPARRTLWQLDGLVDDRPCAGKVGTAVVVEPFAHDGRLHIGAKQADIAREALRGRTDARRDCTGRRSLAVLVFRRLRCRGVRQRLHSDYLGQLMQVRLVLRLGAPPERDAHDEVGAQEEAVAPVRAVPLDTSATV